MDNNVKFDSTFDEVIPIAKQLVGDLQKDLETVLKVAFSDKKNLPNLGYSAKNTNDFLDVIPLKHYVDKFIAKYYSGYANRPSIRKGNSSKTFPDPIVALIFSLRIKDIESYDLDKIVEGHSLQMSIENIIGDLLEEYLSIKLKDKGWYCCWGSSIDAVDFCNDNGDLLQIKNSDNSENSSSSRVRNGTAIKKWSRRKSTKEDTFYWDKLIEMTGVENISENDFRNFVKFVIKNNPQCIYLSDKSIFSDLQ